MPRHCSVFKVDGRTVIACGGTKFQACIGCLAIAALLCDWKVNGGTCDMPICNSCALEVGPDRHLCPEHAKFAL